jgi:hypothetical protein
MIARPRSRNAPRRSRPPGSRPPPLPRPGPSAALGHRHLGRQRVQLAAAAVEAGEDRRAGGRGPEAGEPHHQRGPPLARGRLGASVELAGGPASGRQSARAAPVLRQVRITLGIRERPGAGGERLEDRPALGARRRVVVGRSGSGRGEAGRARPRGLAGAGGRHRRLPTLISPRPQQHQGAGRQQAGRGRQGRAPSGPAPWTSDHLGR